MTAHDRDKALALLKSLAAPCGSGRVSEHAWRKCRHCLAVQELENYEVRALIGKLVAEVEAAAATIDPRRV